jgi:hypothetical protein
MIREDVSVDTASALTVTTERKSSSPLCPETRTIHLLVTGQSHQKERHHDNHPTQLNPRYLTLETFDQNGNSKTVGGDEFYVTYTTTTSTTTAVQGGEHEPPAAVATVQDMNNGRKWSFMWFHPSHHPRQCQVLLSSMRIRQPPK